MNVKILPACERPDEIRVLFSEYTDMLREGDPSIREYLAIQNYDREVEHLEMKYGLPYGRLYMAYAGDEPAGCIGLRKLDAENGEMKRLYVRPAFRGNEIGSLLVRKILKDAEEIGYRHILLDTLPFLQSAIRMYERFGFYEIPRYNDSPMDSSIYMRLDL